ncbi:MAG: hypothetical protein Q8L37_07375 [Candidatus Gottesmanbacteria bacterium]|nr:hypothetical protein [Candidatus Gottesmanbacteria bacterium]
MLILLHGDHIVASRAALTERIDEAKKQGKEIRQLDGNAVDAPSLTQALESSSLFGGIVLVVIEGLLTKLGKKEKQAVQLTDIIKRSGESGDIILWEGKEIGKILTGLLGTKTSIQLFKTPVVIFKFLDGVAPGRAPGLLSLFGEALAVDAPELIFTLLVRRVRQLIQLRDNVTPDGLQGWQAGRLTSQAKSFTMDKLLSMEKNLLDIDVSIKTGTSPFPLAQQLELFIVDL